MMAFDRAELKARSLQFLEQYDTAIRADAAEGYSEVDIVPHPLDSHPHHRISTNVNQQVTDELIAEGRFPPGVVLVEGRYLAPWAGGYQTFVPIAVEREQLRESLAQSGPGQGEQRIRWAEAAYDYGEGLGELVGELTAPRFGLPSPLPTQISDVEGPVIFERFVRAEIMPSDSRQPAADQPSTILADIQHRLAQLAQDPSLAIGETVQEAQANEVISGAFVTT